MRKDLLFGKGSGKLLLDDQKQFPRKNIPFNLLHEHHNN